MKKLTIYVELYEDIPVSDFEQLLLETGIEDIDCSYEIVEDSYEESYKKEAYVREDRFDNTFKVGDEVYIDKGSSLPRIFGKVIDIDGDAITISDGKFTYHPNISKVHLLNLESYKREAYDGQSFYKAIKNDFITAYCAAYGCSKREAEQTYKDCVREGASGLRYMQAVVDDFKDNAKRTFYDD